MKTYEKSFQDRYSYLRELQILELLGQRNAPVPMIISSNSKALTIEMHDAGVSLNHLLLQRNNPMHDKGLILYICAEAVRHLLALAKLGVWHLDFMPRNVLYKQGREDGVEVTLIDFSVCVTDDFRLKKPLWVRPSHEHHELFAEAIIADWTHFFTATGVARPTDFYSSFNIDIEQYRSYWCDDLMVDKVSERYSILAHQVAVFLNIASNYTRFDAQTRDALQALAGQLYGLDRDGAANDALEAASAGLAMLARGRRPSSASADDQNKTRVPTAKSNTHFFAEYAAGKHHGWSADNASAPEPIATAKMPLLSRRTYSYLALSLAVGLQVAAFAGIDHIYSRFGILITEAGFLALALALIIAIMFFIVWLRKKSGLYFRLKLLISACLGVMFSYQIYVQKPELIVLAIMSGSFFLLSLVIAMTVTTRSKQ